MKILFNSPNPKLHGGPPTHLPFLEAKLRDRVTLTPFEYGRKTDKESITEKIFGRLVDLKNTKKLIKKVNPDLIHHNSAFDPRALLRDAPLAWLAAKEKIPLFIKVHGSFSETFTDSALLTKTCRNVVVEGVSAFGVLSIAEKEEFEDNFPQLKGKIFVVKNILKPEFFTVKRHVSDTPTVLFISRFIRKKGMFDLLNAIPQILLAIPETKFIFVGDGPDAQEFDNLVIEKKLVKNVTRLAHVNNLQTKEFYSSAWVFVFPTHFPEGMPMVVAEAMAAGMPIVTTPTRFSRSYMQESKHCLYIKQGNSESISSKIILLLKDQSLRQQMSLKNKELSYQFSADIVTNEFISIYEKIIAENK